MKLLKVSRVSLTVVCLLSFLSTVASYVYTACAEEGDTCSSGYHAIECCDTTHECEQHWKYTYFKCEPKVRRDPYPRKKVKMPRKRRPKSVWDEEKTMYDIRPEISEEIMEILQENEKKPRNILSNNNNNNINQFKQYFPGGNQHNKINRNNPYNKYKKHHYYRHLPKLRTRFNRDSNPPPPGRNRMRNKRGEPHTIMSFTI